MYVCVHKRKCIPASYQFCLSVYIYIHVDVLGVLLHASEVIHVSVTMQIPTIYVGVTGTVLIGRGNTWLY